MGAVSVIRSLLLVAQETEQIEEQVDKVQIQLEGGENRGLGQHLRGGGVVVVERLNLLDTVGSLAH